MISENKESEIYRVAQKLANRLFPEKITETAYPDGRYETLCESH